MFQYAVLPQALIGVPAHQTGLETCRPAQRGCKRLVEAFLIFLCNCLMLFQKFYSSSRKHSICLFSVLISQFLFSMSVFSNSSSSFPVLSTAFLWIYSVGSFCVHSMAKPPQQSLVIPLKPCTSQFLFSSFSCTFCGFEALTSPFNHLTSAAFILSSLGCFSSLTPAHARAVHITSVKGNNCCGS